MNVHLRTKNAAGAGSEQPDVDTLVKAFEQRDQKLLEKMATLQTQVAGTVEQMAQIEQRLSRSAQGGGTGPVADQSFGEQFVAAENVKSFMDSGSSKGGVDFRIKATITSATTNAAGSVGALAATAYRDEVVTLPQRPVRVRDLLPQIQITQPGVEVPIQKARTLAAGMVAEGELKPQSDIQFELKAFNAKTIAHWMKASRQVIDDAPQLRGIIDSELMYGLRLTEDAQLLKGDGTGQNLHGLIPQATQYAAPIDIGADATRIDKIGLALLQSALAEFPADGVVMNPADWMAIRLIKDADGNYIYGPPSEAVAPRIFGVPVVPTQAMTVGSFLVGQFQVAGTIYDRWDARIEMGYVNDDFTRNLITILAEERIAFAVKRPLALTYGTFA